DAHLRASIEAGGSQAFSSYKQVSELVNGAEAIVGTLGPLPLGIYAVTATAVVNNFDHDAGWDCNLFASDGSFIAHSHTSTDSNSGNVAMTGLVINPGTIEMHCSSGIAGSSTLANTIVAVSVGTATIGVP